MDRNYLDDITLDIANSYAALTNRDSSWVNHLSIKDFVEIRKQAILEIDQNFVAHKTKEPTLVETPLPVTQPTISQATTQKVEDEEKSKETKVEKQEEKPTTKKVEKPKETTKEKQETENSQQPKTKVETPKQEHKVQTQEETKQQEQPKVYDKNHDQEELDLFNRLKD